MDEFDYRSSFENDTLEQFRDKPNIQVLHNALARQLQEVHDFFLQLKSCRNLDSAIGKQLDGIGDIVCLSREKAGEYAEMFPTGIIGDEEYRALLKSKIIINTNDATYHGIIKSIRSLYGTFPVYYSEDPSLPATMILELDAAGAGDVTPLGFIPPVKAAGVGILWLYTIRAIIEVHGEVHSVPYSMPPCNTLYCGTFPDRATLGWTTPAILQVSVRLDLPAYLTRFCGTYPSIATQGWMTNAEIQAGFDMLHALMDGDPCGDTVCGTRPTDATVGWNGLASVLASASLETLDYLVRVCGTYPDTATLGWVTKALAAAGFTLESIESDGKPSGTEPDTSTLGKVLHFITAVPGSTSGHPFDPPASGEDESGTIPSTSTIAQRIEAALLSGLALTDVAAIPPFTNTERAGVYPEKSGLASIIDGGADVSGSVEGIKKSPVRSGMTGCGTTPDRVMAGGIAAAGVRATGDVSGVAADVPHGDTECGTKPGSTRTAAETGSAADISCSTEGYQVSAPFCNTKRCGQK